MIKLISHLAIITLSTTISPSFANINKADAATITYDFNVVIDSGSLVGENYAGFFTFDDTILTNTGEEFLTISNFSFNFLGTNYTEADALAIPEAVFFDGEFLGLGYDTDVQFSFIPGFFTLDEAFFSYDIPNEGTGAGDISYDLREAPTTPVPESSTLLSLLLLGFFGYLALFVKPRCN